MKKKYPLLILRGGIYEKCLERIDEELSGADGNLIYLVIESLGGDPSIGYRIMRLLQAKYKKIIVIVPGEAYSTATLMALGSDEIFMRKSACLGPLDIQIKHPTDGSTISSLEIREALNTLAGSLKTYAEDLFDSLTANAKMGKKDAAEISMKTAAELVRPITEKIDPIYLQASTRSSKLGQKYAEDLLTSRMMKKYPRLARAVSIHLANNYDYHGYAIMLEEASQLLALNVKDVAFLAEWEQIKKIYNNSSTPTVALESLEIDEKPQKPQTKDSANAKIKKEGGAEK